VNRWAHRHEAALTAALESGEVLLAADRAVAPRRRRATRALPRSGFVIGITNHRILIWRGSTWLTRDGAALGAAPLGRVHLLLPDRTVVSLRPYGGRTLRHLAG